MNKPLQITIRAIGNSQGIVIPKAILEQMGFDKTAQMFIEGDTLVLSKPQKPVRANWELEASKIAEAGEDRLVMGDFQNLDDKDWVW